MRGRGLRYLVVALLVFSMLVLAGYLVREESPRHVQHQHASTTSATVLEPERLCPVANTSTSFCIVRNGKPYYFAVLGWEVPTIEEVKKSLESSRVKGSGLYVWLKVRTNLELEIDADNDGYVLVGDCYKPVLYADRDLLIRRGNDTYLIPYWISPWHRDIVSLINTDKVRFYFDVSSYSYYDVLPSSGCINQICFTRGHHGPGFYVNYTKPPVSLKVVNVSGKCVAKDLCLYNVTFELRGGYLILSFLYDERTGKKSYADFPIHINVYIERGGKLLLTKEYFPGEVVPPLPSTSIDVWIEPEHEYVATILPPGRFALTFRANGAIYPEPLFNNTPIVIGTPWGGAVIEPRVEVVRVSGVKATTMAGELLITSINATLRNVGVIPVVVPQACFSYDVPPGYALLRGRIDSVSVVYVTQEANGYWDTGGWLRLAIIVNPGETVAIALTPFTPESGFGFRLPLKALTRAHVIEVEAPCTGTRAEMVIPPLKVEMRVHNLTRLYTDELGETRLGVYLNVTNTWIAPINTEWLKLYFDDESVSELRYSVPYEEIAPNKSRVVRVEMIFYGSERKELYEVLVRHAYLRVCLGLTCLSIPLANATYKVGEEVALDGLALRILNVSVVKVIGVKWKEHLDLYRAPKGYRILVAYVEVKNKGLESIFLDDTDFDDSVVVTGLGIFEITYLSDLVPCKNATPNIVVDAHYLWEECFKKLRPGEKSLVVLTFLIPENAEVRYVVLNGRIVLSVETS